MEYWNAYDKHFHRLDQLLVRGVTIPKGMYHLVGEVLVKHIDQTYLITKRSAHKAVSPLTWEASAGGSALVKETALEAAQRELFEECGITSNEWQELGTIVDERVQTLYVGFLCIYAQEKTNIKLQTEETIAYDWVSEDQLIALSRTQLYAKTHQERLGIYLKRSKE